MRVYSARGGAWLALARLADAPASFADLAQVMRAQTDNRRRKCWYVLEAMREDGLVSGAGGYAITASGLNALSRLRSGEDVETYRLGWAA